MVAQTETVQHPEYEARGQSRAWVSVAFALSFGTKQAQLRKLDAKLTEEDNQGQRYDPVREGRDILALSSDAVQHFAGRMACSVRTRAPHSMLHILQYQRRS